MRAAIAESDTSGVEVMPLALDGGGSAEQVRRATQKALRDPSVAALVEPFDPSAASAVDDVLAADGRPWYAATHTDPRRHHHCNRRPHRSIAKPAPCRRRRSACAGECADIGGPPGSPAPRRHRPRRSIQSGHGDLAGRRILRRTTWWQCESTAGCALLARIQR
ncbi:MAG: hypothetical protein R2856_01550 [Caldilineaceae bacterium]